MVGKTAFIEPAQTLREGCVFICTFRCGTSGFYGNNDTHIYRSTASDADPYCCSIRCIHLLLCRSCHHAKTTTPSDSDYDRLFLGVGTARGKES
jgi:hypothetical protein